MEGVAAREETVGLRGEDRMPVAVVVYGAARSPPGPLGPLLLRKGLHLPKPAGGTRGTGGGGGVSKRPTLTTRDFSDGMWYNIAAQEHTKR